MGDIWPEDYYMHMWSERTTPTKPAVSTPPIDPNPDNQRSSSAMWVEDKGRELLWVLKVKGLGALVMRATSDAETGRLSFEGLSEFTDSEIGWRD